MTDEFLARKRAEYAFIKSQEANEDGATPPDLRRLISTTDLFDEYLERKTTIVPCALPALGRLLGEWGTRSNALVTAHAGGGKTAFVVQNLAHAVTVGDFYGVLALKDGDMWTDGLRLAQMAGIDRFALRARDPEAIERAREVMGRFSDRLMFYDVTKPGASFTDMAERAVRWVDGRAPLFIGTDSIHVFPAADASKERGMQIYDRIALRLEVMHEFLTTNDAAGLTVGQSGRAAYSRKREEENVDLLAAVSGGHVAENTVDVLIVITKPNENGVRFLVIPKSRLGGQGKRAPVRYDEERSLWSDAEHIAEEAPRESTSKSKANAKAEDERKAKEAIGLILRQAPEGKTAREVRQTSGRNQAWVAGVIGELHSLGQIKTDVVERVDSRGRKIRVSVWKWTS